MLLAQHSIAIYSQFRPFDTLRDVVAAFDRMVATTMTLDSPVDTLPWEQRCKPVVEISPTPVPGQLTWVPMRLPSLSTR